MLSDDDLLRYNRQLLLPEWDVAGQERLRTATVLVVGVGGLGCALVQVLAAAGVGTLVLADADRVELTNLQRQVLHHQADLGRFKVDSAADTVAAMNPGVRVVTLREHVDAALLAAWLPRVDVVADCCDNFATRDLVSRLAWQAGRPLVSGAAIGWQGQLSVFDPAMAGAPCYRCLYPDLAEAAPTCNDAGVMASTVAVIGSWQAQEVLKVIGRVGDALTGRLLLWNGLQSTARQVRLVRDAACPVCSGPACAQESQ